MKEKIKKLVPIALIFLVTIMFYTYSPTITYDSSHYLWLTNMLTPNDTFANWDLARGITFPLIIHLSNILLGKNSNGILTLMYIAYLLMLGTVYLIFKNVNKKTKIFEGKLKKSILLIVSLWLIILNPLIFGYYHTLLTEFVAITVSIIICYLSWKWLDIDFKESKIKYIIYTIIFALATAAAWHLKQPYVTIALFPVIVATIISIIKKHDKINILQRSVTLISCFIMLILSVITWNYVIKIGGIKIDEKRTSSGYFANGIIMGVSRLEERESKENFQGTEQYNITEKEKQEIEKINNSNSEYSNFTIYENKTQNAKDLVLFTKEKNPTTAEGIKFLVQAFVTSPITVIRSYIDNYFGIIDIYGVECEYVGKKEGTVLIITHQFTPLEAFENEVIGCRIYSSGLSNLKGISERYMPYAEPYSDINSPLRIPNIMMKILKVPTILITKIALFILPFVLLAIIIISIRKRKKNTEETKKIINLIIILLSYSILHIALHIVLGAMIDRYTIPVMIPVFVSYIIITYVIIRNKNEKR